MFSGLPPKADSDASITDVAKGPQPDSCTAAELVLTSINSSAFDQQAAEYLIIKTEGSPCQRRRDAGSPPSAGLFRCASAVAYG